MEPSPTLLSIAWIPALLVLAGLWGMVLGTWRKGQESPALALRLHVGAAVLGLLLCASLLETLGPARPFVGESAGTWLEIGRGLALRAELIFDPLAGALCVAALGIGLLIELAAAERPRALPRVSLALGGLVLCAVGESLVVFAAGWHLCAWASLGGAGEAPGARAGRGGALAVGELGLWIALAAIFAGTGTLSLAQTARTVALGAKSPLVALEVGGAALATIVALGVAVAVIGRALALPGHGDARIRALLGGPALLLAAAPLLLRLAPALTLASTELLGGLGLAAVIVGGVRALAAGARGQAIAGLGALLAGLLLVAAASSAWSAVLGLAVCGAASQATRALALGPRGRVALVLAELALLLGLGHAAAILGQTLWPLAAALPIAAAAAFGAVLGRRPARTPAPTIDAWDAVIPAMGLGLAALAAASLTLVQPATIDRWVTPAILPAVLPSGSPAATGPIAAMTGLAALLFAAGWALGRRRRPWADAASPTRAAPGRLRQLRQLRQLFVAPGAAVVGLGRLGDLLRDGLARRLWLADSFPRPATLLGLLAGLLITLGAVYCNPQVLRLGPSRVHPVDLGGIDPFIVAPKRSGRISRMDATDVAAAAASELAEQAAAAAAAAAASGQAGAGVPLEVPR